jgi:hypothetical protein
MTDLYVTDPLADAVFEYAYPTGGTALSTKQ